MRRIMPFFSYFQTNTNFISIIFGASVVGNVSWRKRREEGKDSWFMGPSLPSSQKSGVSRWESILFFLLHVNTN